MYGKELIIDMRGCDVLKFNRESITEYFNQLCRLIDMTQCDLHFWDDLETPLEERQTSPHTKGTSAVQFIITSNIVVHTLDILEEVYVNIFSCKHFDKDIALDFTKRWFGAKESNHIVVKRGEWEKQRNYIVECEVCGREVVIKEMTHYPKCDECSIPKPPQIRDLKENEQP